MNLNYSKAKQPELVRRNLLNNAIKQCAYKGTSGISIDSVAKAAGVTKGGLLHHFPSKQALIDSIFEELITPFDLSIKRYIEKDENTYGRFTRAYIDATIDIISTKDPTHGLSLMMATLTDPTLRQKWNCWINDQLEHYTNTDSDEKCCIARYAADGIWLSCVINEHELEQYESLAHKTHLHSIIKKQ